MTQHALDVLLAGGQVLDGTGAPPVRADVGVVDGRIAFVRRRLASGGPAPATPAKTVLDVSGLTVCPGFIDIHRHSDLNLTMWPAADSALLQGITTEVIGNCGLGPAPALQPKLASSAVIFCPPDAADWIVWRTYPEFLDCLEQAGLGVNVAGLIPHGALRTSAMGLAARPAAPAELDVMLGLLSDGLDAGAFGLSSGLEYAPGKHSELTEVVALTQRSAELGGLYATHVRNRWDGIVDSVQEAIDTARKSGSALQISHLTARRPQAALNDRLIELVDDAASDGLDIGFDAYPYDWGPGPVIEALPGWLLDGEPAEVRHRLADPDHAARVRAEVAASPIWSAPSVWDDVVVSLAVATPDAVGKSVAELAAARSADPWDVIFWLLTAAGEDYPAVSWIARGLDKATIYETITHPMCAIGSDAATQGGPLAAYKWHPGAYGLTARVLTELVTDTQLLTVTEVVRRMTTLPASRLGIERRGAVLPGFWADLAVLDLPNLRDNATYIEPNRSPDGVVHVLVNGAVAVRGGHLTRQQAGRLLRRTR